MPTVLRAGPYRFSFYAGDRGEPEHIHVSHDNLIAKFWLDPVRLARSGGFRAADIRRIQRLVEANQETLLEAWNEYFGD
jgi:hypothetical protein